MSQINLTFEECFRLYIAEPILGFFLDNPSIKTTIVLAPSLFDAHHTFCFPQPAFAKTLFQYVLFALRSPRPLDLHVTSHGAYTACSGMMTTTPTL